jgi:predicted dehydrogenase
MTDKGWIGMDPAFSYHGLKLESLAAGPKEKVEYKIEEADQFALEMDHFATAVLNSTPVKTPGEEGLRDQVIMEAIYRSAETGRAVTLEAGKAPAVRE